MSNDVGIFFLTIIYIVMKRMSKRTQSGEEIKTFKDASKMKQKQRESSRKYNYIKDVSDSMFTYTFLRAQAEEICDILLNLKLSPFKSLHKRYKEMIEEERFKEDFYIKIDEFDKPVPDYERLSKWLPIKIVITG